MHTFKQNLTGNRIKNITKVIIAAENNDKLLIVGSLPEVGFTIYYLVKSS